MNRSLLLAATALIAVQASASQTAVTHFTLTSANGGASTLVNYSFTGSWLTGVMVSDPAGLTSLSGVYERVASYPGSDTLYAPMAANGLNPGGSSLHFESQYTSAVSGLVFNNLSNPGAVNLTDFLIVSVNLGSNSMMQTTFVIRVADASDPANTLPVSVGDIISLSGVTTGSFTISQAYNTFNEGEWTATAGSFTSTLTIGSAPAVPEPSTYGLALGGLALAVVAVRRRAKRA